MSLDISISIHRVLEQCFHERPEFIFCCTRSQCIVCNCVLTQVVINCMKYVETHLLRRLCRCYESLSIVVQMQTRFEKVFSRAFKFECNALHRRQNLSIFLQFSVVKQTFRWHRPNTNKSKSINATNGNGCVDRLVHISLHQTEFTLQN